MTLVETFQAEHKARLARFAWAAKHPKIKNRSVTHVVPVKPFAQPEVVVVPVDLKNWAEQQMERFKEPWFEIIEGPSDPQPIKIEHIQRVVCRHYLIDRNDMLSNRRTKDVCLPRHVAMYLCKQLTTRSLPEIGRRFNDRDHTTAISAIRKITRMIAVDFFFAAEVEGIRKKCEA